MTNYGRKATIVCMLIAASNAAQYTEPEFIKTSTPAFTLAENHLVLQQDSQSLSDAVPTVPVLPVISPDVI